jgi:hypothetical protein
MAVRPGEKPSDDDELDELPPIDGDGDAGDEAEAGQEDLDDELDADESETGWLDDADEDDALDVGAPDALGEEVAIGALLDGAEETDVGEDDLTFGREDEAFAGDAGEEGFLDEEEAIREEDLPRLDSGSDDAESDDPELSGEGLPDNYAADEPLPPWDDRAWDRAEGVIAPIPEAIAAVSAVACGSSEVLVAGEGIARIESSGALTALEALGLRGGAPSAIAVSAEVGAEAGRGPGQGWLAVSTPRAGVLVSRDAGKSFVEANQWRASVAPADAARGQQVTALASLVACGAELWGCTRGGALVWSGDWGASWSRVAPDRAIDAIAADVATGEIVGLSRGEAGACALVRGKQGRVVASPCGPLPPASAAYLAASGGRVSVALVNIGAFRLDRGAVWSRLDGTASVTALAYGPSGTAVVALCSEGEGRAWIAEARGGDGPARIVAELGDAPPTTHEDENDARVRSMAWDEARGVMWAAGAFGLVALRPPRR